MHLRTCALAPALVTSSSRETLRTSKRLLLASCPKALNQRWLGTRERLGLEGSDMCASLLRLSPRRPIRKQLVSYVSSTSIPNQHHTLHYACHGRRKALVACGSVPLVLHTYSLPNPRSHSARRCAKTEECDKRQSACTIGGPSFRDISVATASSMASI